MGKLVLTLLCAILAWSPTASSDDGWSILNPLSYAKGCTSTDRGSALVVVVPSTGIFIAKTDTCIPTPAISPSVFMSNNSESIFVLTESSVFSKITTESNKTFSLRNSARFDLLGLKIDIFSSTETSYLSITSFDETQTPSVLAFVGSGGITQVAHEKGVETAAYFAPDSTKNDDRITVIKGALNAGGFSLSQDSGAVGIIDEKNHQCLSTKALVAPQAVFEELLRQPNKISMKNYLEKVKNDFRRLQDLFVVSITTSSAMPFIVALDPISNELLRVSTQNLISLPENLVCISSKITLPGR